MIILKARDAIYFDLVQKEIKKMLPTGHEGDVYDITIRRTEKGFKIVCKEIGGRVRRGCFKLVKELKKTNDK